MVILSLLPPPTTVAGKQKQGSKCLGKQRCKEHVVGGEVMWGTGSLTPDPYLPLVPLPLAPSLPTIHTNLHACLASCHLVFYCLFPSTTCLRVLHILSAPPVLQGEAVREPSSTGAVAVVHRFFLPYPTPLSLSSCWREAGC